ncbi:MAG: hypothetical protein MZW92_35860 [Comamonadaceae bacterium]|nr:hypothetical protein [Comamonadaceae bacterium]
MARPRGARRAPVRAARRLGLRRRRRPAHADAAPPGRRGRRPVSARAPSEDALLRYYANSIAHLLGAEAASDVAAAFAPVTDVAGVADKVALARGG